MASRSTITLSLYRPPFGNGRFTAGQIEAKHRRQWIACEHVGEQGRLILVPHPPFTKNPF
jgi:hypothetical protein